MGALLDHRPGVVTKGFRSLPHEQEQEDSWHLDQPEEDEEPHDTRSCLSGGSPAPFGLPQSTSTPSVCCHKFADIEENTQPGGLGVILETAEGKDGHVGSTPPPHSSSPLPPPCESIREKEFQALQQSPVERMPGEGAF